jgi:hypothetical protein
MPWQVYTLYVNHVGEVIIAKVDIDYFQGA